MYYLLLQAGSILELTKMFDDRKSCETVVISKSFVLYVSLAMIIVVALMMLNVTSSSIVMLFSLVLGGICKHARLMVMDS